MVSGKARGLFRLAIRLMQGVKTRFSAVSQSPGPDCSGTGRLSQLDIEGGKHLLLQLSKAKFIRTRWRPPKATAMIWKRGNLISIHSRHSQRPFRIRLDARHLENKTERLPLKKTGCGIHD